MEKFKQSNFLVEVTNWNQAFAVFSVYKRGSLVFSKEVVKRVPILESQSFLKQ